MRPNQRFVRKQAVDAIPDKRAAPEPLPPAVRDLADLLAEIACRRFTKAQAAARRLKDQHE